MTNKRTSIHPTTRVKRNHKQDNAISIKLYPTIDWYAARLSRTQKRSIQRLLNDAIKSGKLALKLPPYQFIAKCNEIAGIKLPYYE